MLGRVLVDREIGERVERGWIVDGIYGNRESAGKGIIGGLAVVDGHGDGGAAVGSGNGSEIQAASSVRAGVSDGRIGNQTWVAGGSGDSQSLGFISRA